MIEGGDIYTQRDMNPNALRGVLAALTIDMGISLLFTKDEQETAQMLFVLAKREEGERGERKFHPHKSFKSIKEEQEYIISAFPDIGMKNARLLLGHFGSVEAIVNAEITELAAVKGIGEKTAQKIYDLPPALHLTQVEERFCPDLYGIHEREAAVGIVIVFDALAEYEDRAGKFSGEHFRFGRARR